ncbi:MAG: lipoprotein-releasing system ATP-binding protein [Gammaproteobacteria bacterium]|jgi:lipoprotein-releasing system ATP-binding protein
MNSVAVLECSNISKVFSEGDLHVEVLKNIDFTIKPGEKVAIVGSSGAGKSTLLHILGGLSRPSSGSVTLKGQELFKLGEKKRGELRNRSLGFIYQFHHLLPEFTALENVAMPLLIRRVGTPEAFAIAEKILVRVGLDHRLQHKPGELSGGERQRTAVARALVTGPDCVLADEPTGNLDHTSAENIFQLLLEISADNNTSVVTVTHDLKLAQRMDRQIEMLDGLLT